VRTANGKWCWQRPRSREGAPGLHGVTVIVRRDQTTEPPAHYRLVSGHDLFEMVALSDCTLAMCTADGDVYGESEKSEGGQAPSTQS
jgi:hypothetical protein